MVEHDEIRLLRSRERDRICRARGITHDVESALRADQRPQALADRVVVVDDQDAPAPVCHGRAFSLRRERARELGLGDRASFDEELTERHGRLAAPLLLEGSLELCRREGARLDEVQAEGHARDVGPEDPPERRDEIDRAERLVEEQRNADRVRARFLRRVGARGEDDDRDRRGGRVGADGGQHLEPVETVVTEVEIEKQEVGQLRAGEGQRLHPVRGLEDRPALRRDRDPHDRPQRSRVVGDENARGGAARLGRRAGAALIHRPVPFAAP